MKKCSFCEQEVQDSALFCQTCGQSLTGEQKKKPVPWYCRTPFLVIGFFTAGPLILPGVWAHPRFSRLAKIIITVITVIWTIYIIKVTWDIIILFRGHFEELQRTLNGAF